MAAAQADGRVAGTGLGVPEQEPPPVGKSLFASPDAAPTPRPAGPARDEGAARCRDAPDNRRHVARAWGPPWIGPGPAGGGAG